MIIKIKYILIFLIAFSAQVQAQIITEVKIGYATFDNSNLKGIQNEVINNNSIPFKITDAFPARPFIEWATSKKDLNGNMLSVFGNYNSTGGRVTASDYSADVFYDQIITNIGVGFGLKYYLKQMTHLSPYFQLHISTIFSELELNDIINIRGGESYNQTIEAAAQNAAISPAFGFELKVLPIPLNFTIEYEYLVTAFPFHLKGNRKAKIVYKNRKIAPEISGLRISIGTHFKLK